MLADQLHVTRQTISRWENGSTYPNLDTLVELSDRLQISLDKLLKSDEVPVAPVVHRISRDVQLKRRYLRGLIVIVSLIVLLGGLIGLLSWGHRNQIVVIDRVNPFLTTKLGYGVLPTKVTGMADTYVSDDPFGKGSWLKFYSGQPTKTARWVLVKHKDHMWVQFVSCAVIKFRSSCVNRLDRPILSIISRQKGRGLVGNFGIESWGISNLYGRSFRCLGS